MIPAKPLGSLWIHYSYASALQVLAMFIHLFHILLRVHIGNFHRKKRATLGIAESLVRISVGIEDVNDIIADIENALKS